MFARVTYLHQAGYPCFELLNSGFERWTAIALGNCRFGRAEQPTHGYEVELEVDAGLPEARIERRLQLLTCPVGLDTDAVVEQPAMLQLDGRDVVVCPDVEHVWSDSEASRRFVSETHGSFSGPVRSRLLGVDELLALAIRLVLGAGAQVLAACVRGVVRSVVAAVRAFLFRSVHGRRILPALGVGTAVAHGGHTLRASMADPAASGQRFELGGWWPWKDSNLRHAV